MEDEKHPTSAPTSEKSKRRSSRAPRTPKRNIAKDLGLSSSPSTISDPGSDYESPGGVSPKHDLMEDMEEPESPRTTQTPRILDMFKNAKTPMKMDIDGEDMTPSGSQGLDSCNTTPGGSQAVSSSKRKSTTPHPGGKKVKESKAKMEQRLAREAAAAYREAEKQKKLMEKEVEKQQKLAEKEAEKLKKDAERLAEKVWIIMT